MRLEKDFAEFIELLNKHAVEYLIVGGYAVAFHGKPRNTKDIDIWIHPTEKNAASLMQVLAAFGFGSLGLCAADFLTTDTVVQLGYSPVRIDLLSTIPGVTFSTAWERRQQGRYGDQTANFIGLDDLIVNKQTVGRLQDLADVELLQEVKKPKKPKPRT